MWLWVVLGILVLGVLFFLYLYSTPATVEEPAGSLFPAADELTAVEQELGAVDLEGLDAELGDIEKELAQ